MGNHISLAVLLCNLFHYQQVEAWLLLGKSVLEVAFYTAIMLIITTILSSGPHKTTLTHSQCLCHYFCAKYILQRETSYILTKNNHTYLVWNPRDGKHYDKCDRRCPLQTVDGLVNGHNVRVAAHALLFSTCSIMTSNTDGCVLGVV